MNKCSRAVVCAVALFCAVLIDEAVASPNPQNRMEMEIMQPEYVAAIAKELEKEGVAALKHQEENNHLTRSEFEAGGFGRNNKYSGHRKPEAFDARRLTETILYPAELIELSNSKRNFDEIDRTGFSGFNKRNFDEIDRTGFSGFNKRNFDEIDRTGFSGFQKRNFDEIDRTSFSGFQKRNFDEIDRSSFPGFNRKRNFDEIDRTGFSGFNKRSARSAAKLSAQRRR